MVTRSLACGFLLLILNVSTLSVFEEVVLAVGGGELMPVEVKSFRVIISGVNGYGVRTICSGIECLGAVVSIGGGITCTFFFGGGIDETL